MTDWYDRVVAKVAALQQQDEDDKQVLHNLHRHLCHAKSARDGEKVERIEDHVEASFAKRTVFNFTVEGGEIVVRSNAGDQRFTDREAALDHMATLMASAVVRSPDNAADDDDDDRERP
jgi:hypothetical protein